MDRVEFRVVSAVRGVPRRYDSSFHAATVATVLAHFYATLGDSASADAFMKSLGPALEALRITVNY